MPIRHIPFFLDPIRGQALLDNINCTPSYSCSKIVERPTCGLTTFHKRNRRIR